jgi:hypothetical protein
LSAGAVYATVTDVAVFNDTDDIAGAPGAYAGIVAELLAALTALLPTAFVAYTVKVYEVSLDKVLNTIFPEAADAVTPPGLLIAVYDVIADPPLNAGGV